MNWPTPNYVDPEERGWAAPIVLLVFLGITFLVYVARMWARIAISKNTGLDDILISLSMIPLFGLTIATVLGKNRVHVPRCRLTKKKASEFTAINGIAGTKQLRLWSLHDRYVGVRCISDFCTC